MGLGRDICSVIQQVMDAIPAGDVEAKESLEKLRYDCFYKAPEQTREMWGRFASLFNSIVPFPPTLDWHKRAASAFTGKKVGG